MWGLVAPGNAMAEVAVDRLLGGAGRFTAADGSTKLKLLGVDVASFGDAFGTEPGSLEMVYADPVAGVYKKLVLSDDARTLRGGILVGDATAYSVLRAMVGRALPGDPATHLVPESVRRHGDGGLELPDEAPVCSCNNVAAGAIRCRGHRTRLPRPRRGQGVHQGRHQLRVVPAAGQEAGHHRGRAGRDHGEPGAVRALRR